MWTPARHPPLAPVATTTATDPARADRAALLLRGWACVLALTLIWDLGGADLAVMQSIGNPHGFALRKQWLLSQWLHDGLRLLAQAFYLLLWVWALWPTRWPSGPAAWWPLPRRERLAVVLLVALCLLVVQLIKARSLTSCPWDLNAFGGPAHYVSHWSLGQADGGGGRCFPGGHASGAFALLPLSLPWLLPPPGQHRSPAAGWRWLGLFLLAGLVAGIAQTLRGAHYPSHTLWTLVICAGVSLPGWHIAHRART